MSTEKLETETYPLHLMQNISYESVMLYPSYYIQGWVVCNGR